MALSNDPRLVLDALINNPWGTTNTFYVDGVQVDKSETSINIEQFLQERGVTDLSSEGLLNLPKDFAGQLFEPDKLELTRLISSQVPEGQGINLSEIAATEELNLENWLNGTVTVNSLPRTISVTPDPIPEPRNNIEAQFSDILVEMERQKEEFSRINNSESSNTQDNPNSDMSGLLLVGALALV